MDLFGRIFSGIIILMVASVMISIGVKQRKSKTPVGFYTGEEPPKAEGLTDVTEWNKKHGLLWIC